MSSAKLALDLQLATTARQLPARADFERWASTALASSEPRHFELTIRLVDADESAMLNRTYRGVDRATNVLSFPFELPPGIATDDPLGELLGDLVICPEVVEREACEQHKQPQAHWAHMVVHGVLHLQGHDHIDEDQAVAMETLETALLAQLGFPPPYQDDH